MNDVCHPFTTLLIIAYRYPVLVVGLLLFNFVVCTIYVTDRTKKLIVYGSLFHFAFLFQI
jgi:hypothetical protein